MNPHILAIRSLASALARDILLPVIIATAIVFILVISLLGWIAYEIGSWLLLLVIPVGFFGVIIGLSLFVLYRTIMSIRPKDINKSQIDATKDFISNLEAYSELKNTPKIFIAWKIVVSALRQSPQEYVSSIVGESTKLKTSYSQLVSSFGAKGSKRKKVENLAD